MAWTTWIAIEPDNTTDQAVMELYGRTRDRATHCVPDTVRLNSLTPRVAGLLYDLQRAIHHDARGLSIREKEITALIVSSYNGCVH